LVLNKVTSATACLSYHKIIKTCLKTIKTQPIPGHSIVKEVSSKENVYIVV